MGFQLKQSRVDGSKVTYVDQGAGDPLLFVHGFPLDHRQWLDQISEFSNRYRVLAPDLPGFGGSDALHQDDPPTPLLMAELAGWLQAFLAEVEEPRPVAFCGLSMGGYIGWQFAQRFKDRLRGLVACNTRAAADTELIRRARQIAAREVLESGVAPVAKTMLPKLFGVSESKKAPTGLGGIHQRDLWTRVDSMIRSTDPRSIAGGHLGMSVRPDMTEWLSSIELPTLFVAGGRDRITPPEEMKANAAKVPGSHYVCLRSAAHLTPLEMPAAFNAALQPFLESI